MKTVKLSVSSAILISVLSGCSQQQLGGSSQLLTQQSNAGSQVASNPKGQPSGEYYESEAHKKERLGLTSQQQAESSAIPARKPAKSVIKPKTPKAKVIVRKKPRPSHRVSNPMGLPPAQPGQCFAKVKTPAKYITKTKRILIQKASAKRVLVRAPQYRWVNKKVLVRKAGSKTRVIPAQYKTVSQRKMVKPSYVTWKKGHGAITRIDNMTGEIMCKVKIPAQYKTVTKRVLVKPAQTIRTYVPAVYKTVKQKQRVSGAIYKTVRKPARYKTQNYRVKVGAARYVWKGVLCKTNAPKKSYRSIKRSKKKASVKQYQSYNFAAKVNSNRKPKYTNSGVSYQHIFTPVNDGNAYYEIQENTNNSSVNKPVLQDLTLKSVLKNRKLSKAERKRRIVYQIQKALKKEGFNPGAIDGKMGPKTAAALKAFQRSNGLYVGKLNTETFAALGMVKETQEMQLASVQ